MKDKAQIAYQNHLSQQKVNWSTMTTDQQDASLRLEKTLQLAADKEIAENEAEAQLKAQQDATAELSVIIAEMKTKGYSGTGSLEDYKKLFNHPEIFGANHENNAQAAFQTAIGFQDFIVLYQQYEV